MTGLLFADLPEAHAPTSRYADNCAAHQCRRCAGSGHERCPYPRHYDIAQTWDPTCRGCNGSGWRFEKFRE